jgi:AcrR family transcriptional regulator
MDPTLTQRALKKLPAGRPVVAAKPVRAGKASKAARRVRLNPEDRKKLIVEEAIRYFAEVGFDAGTHPLAVRLGITQPLIFRYFPNKNDLIEAVYHEVFLSRSRIEWEVLLEDRTRPLRDRLVEFYKDYTEVIFNSRWMRISPLFRIARTGPQSPVHQFCGTTHP